MIGLAPFCAGLRGSESEDREVSTVCSALPFEVDGTGRESANGLSVNSVARGDISASSTVLSCAVGEVRIGKFASILACKF